MLNIQKFCMENENWRELLSASPFFLKIQETEDLVLFKYNQIKSDFNEPICRECRGIILEKETWKVVRMAYKKFFNFEEVYADKIDWSNCAATLKIDGSLISVFYHKGWKVATNGTINAYMADIDNSKFRNWGELFDLAAKNSGLDFDRLDPHYCYTFELVSEFQPIVIQYSETKLYHTLTRNMETLEEENIDIGVEKPQEFKLNNKDGYKKLVDSFDKTKEGIVVRDSDCNRVKIKTPLYFELHRMANKGNIDLERAVQIILDNEQSEFLSYFPQWKGYFNSVELQLKYVPYRISIIKDMVKFYKERNYSRGDFAREVKSLPYAHLCFKEWDGRLDEFIKTMTAKQYITLFNIK